MLLSYPLNQTKNRVTGPSLICALVKPPQRMVISVKI